MSDSNRRRLPSIGLAAAAANEMSGGRWRDKDLDESQYEDDKEEAEQGQKCRQEGTRPALVRVCGSESFLDQRCLGPSAGDIPTNQQCQSDRTNHAVQDLGLRHESREDC